MRTSIAVSILAGSLLSAAGAVAADTPSKAGAVFKDCPTCPEMVVIPPGTNIQGRDGRDVMEPAERYEGPVRKVTIGYSFAVGKTEVTTGQFREFVEATGYKANDTCNIWDGKRATATPNSGWRNPGYGRPAADNEPGACLSFVDAQAFIGWLNGKTGQKYRLLTESEWEYVARAGSNSTSLYAWGSKAEDACKTANVADLSSKDLKPPFTPRPFPPTNCNDGYPFIAPAGVLQPNAFGVYDMMGSIWEWVQDCYVQPYPETTPSDGSAYLGPEGCNRRVTKGGSWSSITERQIPTFRGRDPVEMTSQVFGFRVARDLK
jgi:formylglycine-generating enzyme required for sulfatase activity